MSLIETVIKAHYMATGTQIEQIAHLVVEGDTAGELYLRVMLAKMQALLGRPRRGKQPPQEPVLEKVHEEMYPHALKGVGPPEMEQKERNRLANRFRTMASTVRAFIQNGGDVRPLDVAAVTKSSLRPTRVTVPAGTSRTQGAFIRASEAVKRTASRLARGDPDGAREGIGALMDELQALLDELEQPAPQEHGATTTIVAGRNAPRTSTQPAQLHRGA